MRQELPDPVDLGKYPGTWLQMKGWTHAGKVYAYSTIPAGDGQYKTLIYDATTKHIDTSWGWETADQALGKAALEFAAAAYGTPRDADVWESIVMPPQPGSGRIQ